MLLLVVAEVVRERLVLTLQRQLLGLLVERGLEVLERQREVEDVDVAASALRERRYERVTARAVQRRRWRGRP